MTLHLAHAPDPPGTPDLHELLDTVRCLVPSRGTYDLADMIWRHCQGELLTFADRVALRRMRERG